MASPLEILHFYYHHRQVAALEKHREGKQIVAFTSTAVPAELIRAAGFFPVLLDADCTAFEASKHYMEPVFEHRIKSIFEEILSGKWAFLKALIIPRTSEAEHKLYLYLREVKRLTQNPGIPEIYFFDFLHTQNKLSEQYSFTQFELLKSYLERLSGPIISAEELNQSIRTANRIREQINRLSDMRYQLLLSGKEALTLIGASFFMDAEEYLSSIEGAITAIGQGPALNVSKKILVKGFGINNTDFYESLEKNGDLVVAEDDRWGSRAGGNLVEITDAPLRSLFKKYYNDTPSPRVFPMEKSYEWLNNEIKKGIDRVEYYLSPDDDILGWDMFYAANGGKNKNSQS